MATIFCPDCGAKTVYTLNKPKFCQICGIKVGDVSTAAEDTDETEEEIPHLEGLEYSIDMEDGKRSLGDLFQSPMAPVSPISETPPTKGRPQKHKPETKENFLARSMAECASSRQQPAITKDGAE